MPQYIIPPWIHAADPAGQYARGYGLGQQGAEVAARLQLEQMRMASESERFSREFAYRQQENELKMQLEQQRMQQEKQEFDARMQQSQQQLQLQQQEFQVKQQQASQKAAALMQFQKLVTSGVDPDQAALQVGPSLFQSPAGYAQLAKEVNAKRATVPDSVRGQQVIGSDGKPIPGVFATPGPDGRPMIHNVPGAGRGANVTAEDRLEAREAEKEIADLTKKWQDPMMQRGLKNPATKAQYEKDFRADMDSARSAAETLKEILPNSPVANRILSAGAPGESMGAGKVTWTKDASGKPIPSAPVGGAAAPPVAAPESPAGPPILPGGFWPTGGGTMPAAPAAPQAPKPPQLFYPMGGVQQQQPTPTPATPLSQMQIPAPGAPAPAGPDLPGYVKAYRDELKKGGTNLTKGAKDYLSDMIAGLSDEALVAAANKHGIDDVFFKNGSFGRMQTPSETAKAKEYLGQDMPPQEASIGRMDIEDDLYNAAQAQGWQSDFQ